MSLSPRGIVDVSLSNGKFIVCVDSAGLSFLKVGMKLRGFRELDHDLGAVEDCVGGSVGMLGVVGYRLDWEGDLTGQLPDEVEDTVVAAAACSFCVKGEGP